MVRVSKASRQTCLHQFAHIKLDECYVERSSMSNCMKSLVLRLCIVEPYVPLRTESKRERVASELRLP